MDSVIMSKNECNSWRNIDDYFDEKAFLIPFILYFENMIFNDLQRNLGLMEVRCDIFSNVISTHEGLICISYKNWSFKPKMKTTFIR